MRWRQGRIGVLLAICMLGVNLTASAHRGELDAQGGHSTTQAYHFHKGPLDGKTFANKGEAVTALTLAKGAPSIKLASFNIRIYSTRSRDDRELRLISDQLKLYDIIAIQEVRDSKVLDRTVTILNANTGAAWEYLMSEPVGNKVKERYAFMYRTDRVQSTTKGEVTADPSNVFIREPYIASFRASNFDFTLITIHALHTSMNAPERGDEFEALGQVFLDVQASNPNEQDVILLGSFNDAPSNDAGDKPNKRFQRMIDVVPDLQCLFKGGIRTTITDSALYDNICFQPHHMSEYANEKDTVKFDETEFSKNDKAASRAVSDHRPVWAIFRSDVDDD